MNKKIDLYRIQHQAIVFIADYFGMSERDATDAYFKLVRIEKRANRYATQYCNGFMDMEAYAKSDNLISNAADKALAKRTRFLELSDSGFIINGDPRGYALKIDSPDAHKALYPYRDWGGYAILAPSL